MEHRVCAFLRPSPLSIVYFEFGGKGKHSQSYNKTENLPRFIQNNLLPLLDSYMENNDGCPLPMWFSKITNPIYMHDIEKSCHINNFVDLFYHALGGAEAKRKPMNDPIILENDQYHLDFEIVSF